MASSNCPESFGGVYLLERVTCGNLNMDSKQGHCICHHHHDQHDQHHHDDEADYQRWQVVWRDALVWLTGVTCTARHMRI